ncbi:MAG: formate dehydrogenase subunit gamma [Nitrospirota bacterium]
MTKMVEKASVGERYNHWILVLSFFVLALTGFGFIFNDLNWLDTVFAGNHIASGIHKWAGVVFILSLLFSLASYLGESLTWGPEDSQWMRLRGGYFSSEAEVPPQGKLNAGQKLFYLTVLFFGVVMAASGFILWLMGGDRTWMQIGHFFHNLAFLVFVVAIPVHIYLATAANPGTFRIMTRGTVPLWWAKKRHGKWVKEAGLD